MAALTEPYSERALLFGEQGSLLGIMTRPLAPAPPDGRPVVVILNTGIVHRIGHHRMYVTLSRRLASAGHTVLRFDFSGIGDSAPREQPLAPLESCLADIREALDWLQRSCQATRFLLVGLCAGADHAALYAAGDPRVVGLVLMDPTLPPTGRYYFHYVMQRLTNLRSWVSVATGRSGLLTSFLARWRYTLKHSLGKPASAHPPLHARLAASYGATARGGVRVLAAFTAPSTRHSYPQQMIDAFPQFRALDHLQIAHFPDSDHLFSAQEQRERLLRLIGDWIAALPGVPTKSSALENPLGRGQ